MISEELKIFIRENFNLDSEYLLNDDTEFFGSGIIDSTGILEVVSFLEEKYNIHVEDEELVPENLDSVARIIKFLEKKNVTQ